MTSWSLKYSGVNASFDDDGGIFLRSFPDVAQYDITNEDVASPRSDGTQFGQDFHGGRTIGLSFGIDGPDEATVRDRWAQLAEWWSADVVRSTPGAMAELVSDRGRSAYGRPRRLAPSAYRFDETPPLLDLEADFAQADKLWYGAARSETLTLVPSTAGGGGLVSPLVSPLATTGSTDRSQVFTVLGDRPTWGTYTIHGPITNPIVELVNGWKVGLAMTIPYDRAVQIITLPWNRRLRWVGGGTAGPLAAGSTPFAQTALPVGDNEVFLRGTTDGNPTLTVAWRDAYSAP